MVLKILKYSAECKYNDKKQWLSSQTYTVQGAYDLQWLNSICDDKHDIAILTITISINSMQQIFANLVKRWS